MTRFYEEFGDNYDFANVIYLHPDSFLNRDHFAVKNDVSGIGQPLIDQTAQDRQCGCAARNYQVPARYDLRFRGTWRAARGGTSMDRLFGRAAASGRRLTALATV